METRGIGPEVVINTYIPVPWGMNAGCRHCLCLLSKHFQLV